MCYEKQYYEQKDTAASQPKKQDTKREELVSSLLRDAEKAGHKAKDSTPSTKEPVLVK
jgi:hypothetical protein